ncbi:MULTISPECIES: HNH endonuclease signature motif containing protein [unclassified Nocardioides]|uniref:HNH endonuclease signature motif containing protein n=1 Tax=unclassified Nocardioides TaxID=2615069 RepID=UPI000AD99411|nr:MULTISPECIES: HNH endonuclease [unclassified Nocardioides]
MNDVPNESERGPNDKESVDDEYPGDVEDQIEEFLGKVFRDGAVPVLPTFLGEEWTVVFDAVRALLEAFTDTMVLEVTLPDGTEVYAQFAYEGDDIAAEMVSNEFLEGNNLAADRVSLMVDLGWSTPHPDVSPNFSRVFVDPNLDHVAWQTLQTLHDVYDAVPEDQWAVIPADLAETLDPEMVTYVGHADDSPMEVGDVAQPQEQPPWHKMLLPFEDPADFLGAESSSPDSADDAPLVPVTNDGAPSVEFNDVQLSAMFKMPKAVTIMGRSSSVTNSFVNSLIPVIVPTAEELRKALAILGMSAGVECVYCGDTWTEWDHLRPIVVDQAPTGYISEIHNLVPACGKCNQSKGNRYWRTWMFGPAKLSPKTRDIADIEARATRLEAYEQWKEPTKVDFAQLVGEAQWASYWGLWKGLLQQMQEATVRAREIKNLIAKSQSSGPADPIALGGERMVAPSMSTTATPSGGWFVSGPDGTVGPFRKNRTVLEAVRALVATGYDPARLVPLLGKGNFRPIDGVVSGDELWDRFAALYGKEDKHRKLWFVDAPVHRGGTTWILANNVWGPKTREQLKIIVTRGQGSVTIVTPTGGQIRRIDNTSGMRVLPEGSGRRSSISPPLDWRSE